MADAGSVRQTAIVTGAARGIGFACASALADAGYRVVLIDIDEDAGTKALASITGDGHEFVSLDLRNVPAIATTVDEIHARVDSIDVLVNNAGVTRAIDLFDVDENDWNRIAEVNSRGTFFILQAVAARMARGASIVNIASIAGKGWKETSNIAYAGSKGAVIAMTRIAATRLGRSGIRLNAVCPGITTTDRFRLITPRCLPIFMPMITIIMNSPTQGGSGERSADHRKPFHQS